MASRKQCVYNEGCKQMATANCEGCLQALCTKHFVEHRRVLEKEMNEVISEHDQLQYTLNLQAEQPNSHPLMKEINEWEKLSIVKIQQKANELRQELLKHATGHIMEMSKNLRSLSENLKKGQEEDSFVETDLQGWKKILDELKSNFTSPSTFRINQQSTNPLVHDLSVVVIGKGDLFERTSDNKVTIAENGQLAINNDGTGSYIEVRGKDKYTSGRHKIHLRIEQSTNCWTFVGINSESAPLQNSSYSCRSTYGWSSNNVLWLGGIPQTNTTTKIDMKTNDIISLILDCDNRKIFMNNEQTKAKYEMVVNISQCPFPWQLQVILMENNCRVRILS